ncbi:helix-turn-helix domain-containing protein [Bacillus massiliglaciei]|uniref:helix-turn-helix domain-containing protein n=1 Tax=Bacillus massiliglaciei TaxID=1816693 RepID=UPI000A9BA18D|nr:helix-turn-helix domain-containing protein [Bacillus massiliglaciei]
MNSKNHIERRLHTFIQVSKNIITNESLTNLVEEIIEEVIQGMDKADAGFLLLWDEDRELLKIEAAVNFREEMYLQNTLLPGEGISGTVFENGQSLLINTEEDIRKAMSNMRNQTLEYYLKSTIDALIPVSCISVPLIHQNQKIGVLTIDNFKNPYYFSEEDLRFLEAIGNQIAISIVNARAYHEKQKRTEQLETILTFHNQLNEAVLKGSGLQSLIEKLADIIQRPIYYFDPLFRFEFSDSEAGADIRSLQDWLRKQSDSLIRSQQIQVIYTGETVCGHALAVQSSFGTIGYMVIAGNTSSLDIINELVVKHAASIIAMEQIKFQERMKHRQAEKGALLSELLQGNLTAEVQSSLKKFGMQHAKSYCFLLLRNEKVDLEDMYQVMAFEEEIVQVFAKEYYVTVFPDHKGLFILLGAKSKGEDHRKMIRKQAARLLSVYSGLTICIGRMVKNLQHTVISYKDAELSLMEGERSSDETRIGTFRDLGVKRYLMELSEEDAVYFVEEILGEILTHSDWTNRNEWLVTLQAYLQCNKHVGLTAKKLHLHPNTVYYRLQQLQEKLSCDLDNIQDMTNLYAALLLYEHHIFKY